MYIVCCGVGSIVGWPAIVCHPLPRSAYARLADGPGRLGKWKASTARESTTIEVGSLLPPPSGVCASGVQVPYRTVQYHKRKISPLAALAASAEISFKYIDGDKEPTRRYTHNSKEDTQQ